MNKTDLNIDGLKNALTSLKESWTIYQSNLDEKMKKISEIKQRFDQSLLPYIVNFTDYHKINTSFYNIIKDDLVPIF